MAWVNRKLGCAGSAHQKLYQSLLDNAMQAPARNAKRRKSCTRRTCPGRCRARGC